MSKSEGIQSKIDVNKEILNALPRNNEKNINNYVKALDEFKKEFVNYDEQILKEMEKRVEETSEIKENPELISMKQEINNIEDYIYLLNNINTSYEKMNLDRAIHNLKYYYKKNLKIVNETILFCIRKFREVGIVLKLEDFCYSKYVKEYLTIFFAQMKNENIDLKKIQSKFDEIYWKCSNLIIHIELNIRYLYLKHEKAIDKFYSKKRDKLLEKETGENIINQYMELKKQLIKKTNEDQYIIINSFIEGYLNVKDFLPSIVEERYNRFISQDILEGGDEDKLNEIDLNMGQLSNSLYEYKNYLEFKFIIDDVKKIYEEKDKYKNTYEQIKKEIATKEKKIMKMNNKISGRGMFKKSNDGLITMQDELIIETKKLYKELDKNKVYYKIATQLNDNSTITDVLHLAGSFYNYIFSCIREMDNEIEDEEVEEMIANLEEFIKWPCNTILNNIGILENKDILLIIKDRYQLLNINMSKEDLKLDNLDALMATLKNIEISHNIRKNKINLETIGYICEMKKILDK